MTLTTLPEHVEEAIKSHRYAHRTFDGAAHDNGMYRWESSDEVDPGWPDQKSGGPYYDKQGLLAALNADRERVEKLVEAMRKYLYFPCSAYRAELRALLTEYDKGEKP